MSFQCSNLLCWQPLATHPCQSSELCDCGDSLCIQFCIFERGGWRGRSDFPQLETENLQHIYRRKASTLSSASGWSTEVPVREQHIVFWDRFATDAGWYGCPGVLSKAVSHEAFCNAAPGCSLIHVLAAGGCLPLQRFSQAQYSPGHLLLHSPDLFSVSNLVRM